MSAFQYIKKARFAPSWLILTIDICITLFSLVIAFFVKQSFFTDVILWHLVVNSLAITCLINLAVFILLKTYHGIVRYTGLQDAIRIALACFISAILLLLFNNQFFYFLQKQYINFGVIIIYATFSFMGLMSYRVAFKYLIKYLRNIKTKKKNVIIFGAADAGVATLRVLENEGNINISILAFVDDDKKKVGKKLNGISILSYSEFQKLVSDANVDELIIASFSISAKRKNELVDFCLDHDIKILSVPPYSQWSDGSFATRQLRIIRIEDLLERDPIFINNKIISDQIKGKRVLVTGAAGSIGSEIVRQLLPYHPEILILCDQAETPLHYLDLEIKELKYRSNCVLFLADITNEMRMRELFEEYNPQYVYHAAAYKHVPMMELNPVEAVKNNVLGTQLVADLSVQYEVDRFVMISTDKAVNPTNVMGASKRLAEMYVQGLSSNQSTTKFITTRFGNVLGSNGSVVVRFKEQIEKGGPVTVTHPNITRYFMTIPEACQLVLEAGSMGNGGEIFVFDMGQQVTIADLAKKMIRLYGLIPNIDINIVYSGLRPGEKLYEELLNDKENTTNTYHEKILIAKVRGVDYSLVQQELTILRNLMNHHDCNMLLVAKMKELVPEFVSNNSVFEKLDKRVKVINL